jgi:cytochrome c peroxidase
MHNEMFLLKLTLKKSDAYKLLFKKAFGDEEIDPDRITEAIATFEKTIVGKPSRYDEFLMGNKNALTNQEIKGLHLFRTKARCMNCHHGALFSDNSFHRNGFTDGDNGIYIVTHKDEDIGKIKTPSLRDVMKTKPWMHNGSMHDINLIIDKYDRGPLTSSTDPLIRSLHLTKKEKESLIAFLNAISSDPLPFKRPSIPE